MPPKVNAFMIFVQEWRRENDPYMSIQDAVQEAGKIWEKMPEDERKPYHERCRELKAKEREEKNKRK